MQALTVLWRRPFHTGRAMRRALQCLGAILIVAAIVAVSERLPHINVTTVALVLVLAVLGIAIRWGRPEVLHRSPWIISSCRRAASRSARPNTG